MKKSIIFIVFLALATAAGYFGLKKLEGPQRIMPAPFIKPGEMLSAHGSIAKNGPGMIADAWYFVPEAARLSSRLIFDGSSQCFFGEQIVNCSSLQLMNGARINVSGKTLNEGILVSKLVSDPAYYISVDSPKPGDAVSSTLRVTGKARGYWYFEATFPVRLVGKDGNPITSTFMEARSDWMTEEYVPFDKEIGFSVSTSTPAYLILANDNPSGLPENSKEIQIPVTLLPGRTRSVGLYYYSPNNDKDKSGNIMCSRNGLVRVERQIPVTEHPLQDAVNLLLSGNLSEGDKAEGLSTEFPLQGVKLLKVVVNNGVATLTFEDPNNRTSGGSCRAAILWAQIEATAKQFPGIKEVKFSPAYLFQP